MKNFLRRASAQLAIQQGDKTVDPRYTTAKENYRTIAKAVGPAVDCLLQLEESLKAFNRSCFKLVEDTTANFEEEPLTDSQIAVKERSTELENLMVNELIPKYHSFVVDPLTKILEKVPDIQAQKDNHTKICREYDILRIDAEHAQKKHREFDRKAELENVHREYDRVNEEFIDMVVDFKNEATAAVGMSGAQFAILIRYALNRISEHFAAIEAELSSATDE